MSIASIEDKQPGEDADVAEIVRGILAVQRHFASEEHRPLCRGTHAKGVCARASFEVFDLATKMRDRALAARLAQGLFARPGTYPAIVRFANAESRVRPDGKADVRAFSFSVEVPAGVLSSAAARVDYSMNNAPVFPINDAHAFAALMKVAGAGGALAKAKAFVTLPLRDQIGLLQTAVRGASEKRDSVRPYQQMRYWSSVPFQHGATDAVKYSAIPDAGNPARPLQQGPNLLRDELVRHLNEDSRMAAFDVVLQLLDVERMTCKGARKDAAFWIENAAVEWKEAEAPFHVVGRLTLVPKSQFPPEACEAMYMDVTEHAAPDSRPLGSINRARWAAESASRKARMGAR